MSDKPKESGAPLKEEAFVVQRSAGVKQPGIGKPKRRPDLFSLVTPFFPYFICR